MKFSLPPCRYQQHQYERALISPTRKCSGDEPPTKNASLIPQIIWHYQPAGFARINSVSSSQFHLALPTPIGLLSLDIALSGANKCCPSGTTTTSGASKLLLCACDIADSRRDPTTPPAAAKPAPKPASAPPSGGAGELDPGGECTGSYRKATSG
jgi:hypothetical protein